MRRAGFFFAPDWRMTGRWTPAYDRLFDPDHELAGEPVCMRWAWLDLCHLTQKEDGVRVVKMKPVRVRRGEVLASVRFLAKRWNWSKSKVQRFLDLLKSPEVGKLVEISTSRAGTIYRVKTHEAYALGGTAGGTAAVRSNSSDSNGFRDQSEGERDTSRYDSGTLAGHQRDTNGTNTRRREEEIYPQLNARDDLAEWLGEYSGLVSRIGWLDERARRSIVAQYGPDSMRSNAWRLPDGSTVPTSERPRLLALALVSYDGEGKRRVVTSEFDGLLRKVAVQEAPGADGADVGQETPEDRHKRYIEIRRGLMAQGMSDDEAAAEAERRVTT